MTLGRDAATVRRMRPVLLAKLLILLAVANGAPVVAKRMFGARYAYPIDGNRSFVDGRPLLGPSKTFRGILASLLLTGPAAVALGLGLGIGLSVALGAMAGDLASSFAKRRLGLSASARATGLDQVPESLFALLICRSALLLSVAEIAAGCALFFVGEVLLSRVLFRLHVRDRPY